MAKGKKTVPAFQWSDQLVLFRYFLSLFGKNNLADLAGKMNSSEYEGFDENQNTYFWGELDLLLMRQGADAKISRDTLREYDERICRYVKKIGEKRGGIKLKYFQYIACLFTEIYLDRYFTDKEAFAADLNAFIEKVKVESFGAIDIEPFTPENMNKLAFMCATGSGKTLIMHINILQFRYYLRKAKLTNPRLDINKIIVLAPNQGMSNQHLEELKLSDISAEPFSKSGFGTTADVIVIDMNKLKEEGKVKTVSVDSFEQNNLVLVDEAHRGLAGDVWYDYRSRLSAEGGFAFEYSATLKQAMKSTKPGNISQKEWKERLDEYFRSIIIDYSYKYFYEDGYGKEYRIYNLRDSIEEEQRQLYLVGCLLSFYQQLKLFCEKGKEYAPFRIEKPLLVFVGNRVTAKTSVAEMTDVEEVLDFIDKFVNRKEQTINRIDTVLSDDTGLTDSTGRELFSQNFNALNSLFGGTPKAEDVYKDILRLVFNSDTTSDSPRLHVINLRQVQGEIALRIGSDGEYFGVVSIGDTAGLIKNCEAKGITTGTEEFVSESLFHNINERNSNINILIGSRKFTEGWNSWRVSTMGLINFAKGEGSQAIQLFGRGVRLKGYGNCLKRSSKLDYPVEVPRYINKIETLTIFGVKADYMAQFKEYLEKEDMDLNDSIREFKLPVVSRFHDAKDKLKVIKVKDGINFKKQSKRLILTTPSDGFMDNLVKNKVKVDYNAAIQSLTSTRSEDVKYQKDEAVLEPHHMAFLDVDKLYAELLQYKNQKAYYNISIEKSLLPEILKLKGWYTLFVPRALLEIDSFDKIGRINCLCVMLLKNYLDRFFKYHKAEWEAPHLVYGDLKSSDKNFIDAYNITLFNKEKFDEFAELIEGIKESLEKNRRLGKYEDKHLNFLYFDFYNHLYTPLISIDKGIRIEVSPVSLNSDEKLFIDRLKKYCADNPSAFIEKRLYLLRNKSKVGIGFFEADNFYPDYIMWIAEDDKQYITFVDPKGIMMLEKNINNPKIQFYKTIKDLEARLQSSCTEKQIILNSFIMSGTSAADVSAFYGVKKPEFERRNVLFLEDEDCIEKMMSKIYL